MEKVILLGIVLFLSGCSQQDLVARVSMVRAEQAYEKGHSLRIKKEIPYEVRLKYYRQACDDFYRAYQQKRELYTYNRIGMAADACFRVKELGREKELRQFEEEYTRLHPDEVEYGDAGPFMTLEG